MGSELQQAERKGKRMRADLLAHEARIADLRAKKAAVEALARNEA